MPRDYDVPILGKTIEILDFIRVRSEASFADICSNLNYAKSTTYQILRTLQKHNLINQTESGRYQLGYKFLTWGDAVAKNIDIRKISHGILQKLAETVGVSVHLAIKTGPVTSIFVEKIDGALYTIHNTILGAEIVWQSSACGKVLFAWSLESEQQQILDAIKFHPYTSHSIMSREAMMADISQVRQNGYAIDRCEWTDNVYGIGVPVFDRNGKVIAAMSCAILASGMEDQELISYVDYLKDASTRITAKVSD